jgi:hypothetical protein
MLSEQSRPPHIGIAPRFSSQQVSPDREYEVGLRDGSEYYTKGMKETSQPEFWILGKSEPHQGQRPWNGEVMGGAFQGSGAVSEAKFSCQESSSNSKHQVSCFHHTWNRIVESFEFYSCGTSWKGEGMKCVSIGFDQQEIRGQDRHNLPWYWRIQVKRWKWGKMWKETKKLTWMFSLLHIYAILSSIDVLVIQTISSPASPQSRLGCRSQASATQLPRIFSRMKEHYS